MGAWRLRHGLIYVVCLQPLHSWYLVDKEVTAQSILCKKEESTQIYLYVAVVEILETIISKIILNGADPAGKEPLHITNVTDPQSVISLFASPKKLSITLALPKTTKHHLPHLTLSSRAQHRGIPGNSLSLISASPHLSPDPYPPSSPRECHG